MFHNKAKKANKFNYFWIVNWAASKSNQRLYAGPKQILLFFYTFPAFNCLVHVKLWLRFSSSKWKSFLHARKLKADIPRISQFLAPYFESLYFEVPKLFTMEMEVGKMEFSSFLNRIKLALPRISFNEDMTLALRCPQYIEINIEGQF